MTKPATPDMTPGKKGTAAIKFNLLMLVAVMTLILNCATQGLITKATPPQRFGEAVSVGNLANPQINEASGLASSRLYPAVLWVINDGGNDPMLYAVGIDGADLGTFRVDGASNYDWEALASFRLQDTAYILIADVGDNWEQRETSSLYVVEEPSITKTGLNAFKKQPQRLHFSQLSQQEAACFGFYGKSVYVTSEKRPAPLIRIDLDSDATKP